MRRRPAVRLRPWSPTVRPEPAILGSPTLRSKKVSRSSICSPAARESEGGRSRGRALARALERSASCLQRGRLSARPSSMACMGVIFAEREKSQGFRRTARLTSSSASGAARPSFPSEPSCRAGCDCRAKTVGVNSLAAAHTCGWHNSSSLTSKAMMSDR